jgi:hypothetical protein
MVVKTQDPITSAAQSKASQLSAAKVATVVEAAVAKETSENGRPKLSQKLKDRLRKLKKPKEKDSKSKTFR